MPKKKIYININAAIERYNRSFDGIKKPMTIESLGQVVFSDRRLSNSSRKVYLSSWNNGKMIERCRVENLILISKSTGVSLPELITEL